MTTYNVTKISTVDAPYDRVQVGEYKTARDAIAVIKEIIGTSAIDADYGLGICHFLTPTENVKVVWS